MSFYREAMRNKKNDFNIPYFLEKYFIAVDKYDEDFYGQEESNYLNRQTRCLARFKIIIEKIQKEVRNFKSYNDKKYDLYYETKKGAVIDILDQILQDMVIYVSKCNSNQNAANFKSADYFNEFWRSMYFASKNLSKQEKSFLGHVDDAFPIILRYIDELKQEYIYEINDDDDFTRECMISFFDSLKLQFSEISKYFLCMEYEYGKEKLMKLLDIKDTTLFKVGEPLVIDGLRLDTLEEQKEYYMSKINSLDLELELKENYEDCLDYFYEQAKFEQNFEEKHVTLADLEKSGYENISLHNFKDGNYFITDLKTKYLYMKRKMLDSEVVDGSNYYEFNSILEGDYNNSLDAKHIK